jgi:hypothetical protein
MLNIIVTLNHRTVARAKKEKERIEKNSIRESHKSAGLAY